jgi:hypothetical protein
MTVEANFETGSRAGAESNLPETRRRLTIENPRMDRALASEVQSIIESNRAWTQWRAGLSEGEEALYNQGLLDYGQHFGEGTRAIRGVNGTRQEIAVEGIEHRRGATLFVPRTTEAQAAHGAAIAKPKSEI